MADKVKVEFDFIASVYYIISVYWHRDKTTADHARDSGNGTGKHLLLSVERYLADLIQGLAAWDSLTKPCRLFENGHKCMHMHTHHFINLS